MINTLYVSGKMATQWQISNALCLPFRKDNKETWKALMLSHRDLGLTVGRLENETRTLIYDTGVTHSVLINSGFCKMITVREFLEILGVEVSRKIVSKISYLARKKMEELCISVKKKGVRSNVYSANLLTKIYLEITDQS